MENNKLNNDFSISAKRGEEQRRIADEQERQRQIAQIKDQNERQQIQEMTMMRDTKLQLEKERAEREEKAIYDREIQKRAAAKEEMHNTMDKVKGMSLEQRKKHIRDAVRNSHGVQLDQHRLELEKTLNKEIDREIKQSLDKQRQQEQSRAAEHSKERDDNKKWFQRNAASATREGISRQWEGNAFNRDDGGRTRER